MALVVRSVEGRRDLRAFIDLPYRLHARDPLWAPPLRSEVRSLLNRKANPFFLHGDADLFLAEEDGRMVGRIAAIDNHLHTETHRDGVGFFGFFECEERQEVATRLLETAAGWAREHGFRTLRGPTSFSINDECGLLVEGHDLPPSFMMPHNPPYYSRLLERAGFGKAKDLWVYRMGSEEGFVELPERLTRGAELISRRMGITIRSLHMDRFKEEVQEVRRIFNLAWRDNWGFVPLTEPEVEHLARQFRPVVDPDLVPFAEKDGRVIGFALALPDLNEVLRHNRGGRLLPGALKLLWALKRRSFRRARILLLGVLPEYRGKGIDTLLYHWIWTRAGNRGIFWGEGSWVLEDNPAIIRGLEKIGGRRYKVYRLYEREL